MRTVRPQGARFALGVGLVLAAIGATAAPSSAMSLPAPEPASPKASAPVPSPGPARTLLLPRGDGQRIRVSWPSGHRIVAPASTVRVRVSQPRRGERKLTVNLLRISAKGRILGSVQRTGVTRGTVSVAIPKGAGRRYSLRIALGPKVLRRLTIQVPKAEGPAVAPAAPAPPGNTGPVPFIGNDMAPWCTDGPAVGTIELSAPSLVVGGEMRFSVLNAGQSCLAPIDGLTVERQDDDGDWVRVGVTYALPDAQVLIYQGVLPGGRGGLTFHLQPDALPGTYRMKVPIRSFPPFGQEGRPFTPQTATLTSETFAVTAAP